MTTTRAARVIAGSAIAALALGLAGLAGIPAQADPAEITPCATQPNGGLAPGEADFDGDGQGDVAYGLPKHNQGGAGGSVVVTQSSRGIGKLTVASVGDGAPAAGDGFGTVVLAQDVDGDACTDLVVSAPGTHAAAGRVYILFGATTGLGTGRPVLTLQAPKPSAGDHFGAAVDARRYGNADWVSTEIAIGAPGTDVAGASDAGAVHLFDVYGFDGPYEAGTFGRVWSWSQGAKGVGTAERGDHFGEVLTVVPARRGVDVVVGVPREDVGKATDAGVVNIRTRDEKVVTISQNTKGITGKAETGDRFGAALVQSGRTLAVSAAGESIGKLKRAGQVQVLTQKVDRSKRPIPGAYTARRSMTLNTSHVTGSPRKNDHLGTSLAILRGLQHTNGLTLAAGMPARSVGNLTLAGAVALFELAPSKCPKKAPVCGRVITQSTPGVAGGSVENGRFGSTLAIFAEYGPTQTDERRDALLAGTPGGSVGSTVNVGSFVQWRPAASSLVTDPSGTHAQARDSAPSHPLGGAQVRSTAETRRCAVLHWS